MKIKKVEPITRIYKKTDLNKEDRRKIKKTLKNLNLYGIASISYFKVN